MMDEPKGQLADLVRDSFVRLPKVDDIIKGQVISIESGAVRLDVNGLAVGVIRGLELFSEAKEFAHLKIGDEVEATVVEQENEQGELELSFRAAGHQRVWDRIMQFMKDGLTISGKVLQANRGGLMVQTDALVGFMPVSQLNPDHYPRVPGGDKNKIFEHLKQMIGKDLQVKVIDVNQAEGKLIVSEKAVWEDEQKAVLESYKIGDIIAGEVGALTSFGAFIKFGEGLEGLVHISEIAWQRIDHPKDVLKVGDRLQAQIIDLNKSKIYLSLKRLTEDPWKKVKDKYQLGQIVDGEVAKVEPFGLMVKLDLEIYGLAHLSEISDEMIYDVSQLREKFTVGGIYRFEIISVEPAEHRLGLKLEGVKGKSGRKKAMAETKAAEAAPASQPAMEVQTEAVAVEEVKSR